MMPSGDFSSEILSKSSSESNKTRVDASKAVPPHAWRTRSVIPSALDSRRKTVLISTPFLTASQKSLTPSKRKHFCASRAFRSVSLHSSTTVRFCRERMISSLRSISKSPPFGSFGEEKVPSKSSLSMTKTRCYHRVFYLIKAQPLPVLRVLQMLPYRKLRSLRASYG